MRLYKRGRTWWCWYYDSTGKRVRTSTHCQDKNAADRVARQLERDAADPDNATAREATLSDALDRLLRDREAKAKRGERSMATVGFYREKAGHWVRILERDDQGREVRFLLSVLKPRHIDQFIEKRTEEGASSHTIAKELVTIRAALKLAKRAGLWHGDIEKLLPSDFSTQYKPKKRSLSREELYKLLAELEPDRAARIAFIVATSACWGETVRAVRAHVAKDLRTVLIDGTKRASRQRIVPIVSVEQRSLLEYALEHAQGTDGDLFTHWQNARRDIHRACDRAGIPRCSPNDLRRTCATWLHAAGVTPDLIAPIMGHADSRMVERVYGRLSSEQLGQRIAATLGCDTFVTASVDSGAPDGQSGRKRDRKQPRQGGRSGAQSRNRTRDTRIFSPLLYQLS